MKLTCCLCFGLALLSTSCLTPPGYPGSKTAGAAAPPRTAPAIPKSLGDFSRSSPELLATLRPGWNLGNSLDVPDGETKWGNPAATPELFAAIAKAGFKLVRVPVTWAPHLGGEPGYVIEPSWLERVAEVVGYARAAGLYCIINVHHDGADGWKGVGCASRMGQESSSRTWWPYDREFIPTRLQQVARPRLEPAHSEECDSLRLQPIRTVGNRGDRG